jgi:hypothetical protein
MSTSIVRLMSLLLRLLPLVIHLLGPLQQKQLQLQHRLQQRLLPLLKMTSMTFLPTSKSYE